MGLDLSDVMGFDIAGLDDVGLRFVGDVVGDFVF
jgi:hypothetical protein